ncbi:Hypothetical_protein [Hexamita inflata]|uniref:Hypothetical_protein n=1 Tax=Hexamita inflata TaxID=28002 RepID=A0AA86PSW4_9EUKA|nr:Hypothetical protein HINF_LOCUS28029 [Hexamita inflata]
MHADYRKQVDFIVKAQNSPSQFSPEHSKTYIPRDFIKNPLLSKFGNELNNVQLELLQSRNPHNSRTLGLIKNQQFSPPRNKITFRSLELVPEIQEEGLLFEICNEANQNNLKTVTDWERLNGKKLNQIISDEY